MFTSMSNNVTGISGATAPMWPSMNNGTVLDNGITWKMNTSNAVPQRFVVVTGGSYNGNAEVASLGTGVWSINNASSCTPSACTATDMVTAFPVPGDWPYMYAVELFDAAYMANRSSSTTPPPSAFSYVTIGITLNAQNLPVGGSTQQSSSNYLNGGVTTTNPPNQWTQFLCGTTSTVGIGLSTHYYINDFNIMAANPAFWGKLQIGPQGGPSSTDSQDPTALADACAFQGVSQGLGLTFEGAQASDNTKCPGIAAGDWCHIMNTYYNVPNMSLQPIGPGSCTGSGNGRMDQQLANALNCQTPSYELYPGDWQTLDPNTYWYPTCGTAYTQAVLAFQNGGGWRSATQPSALRGIPTRNEILRVRGLQFLSQRVS
jgi:hypothetical protein